MVAVDKTLHEFPTVVGAELYDLKQLGLNVDKFDVTDLIKILQEKTVLMNWMQQSQCITSLPSVHRVIVHIEQISKRNKYNKQFEIEFGRLLQRLTNIDKCVVQLSQPHIHRATGPMFKLGKRIVETCHITPAVYSCTRSRLRKTYSSGKHLTKSDSSDSVKCRKRDKVSVNYDPDLQPNSDKSIDCSPVRRKHLINSDTSDNRSMPANDDHVCEL